MQCKCGGDTRITESVNKKLHASLEYYECKSCSRVSSATLWIKDELVAGEPLSRMHYQALDKDLAKELLASAKSKAPEPASTPHAAMPTTIPLDKQNIAEYQTGSLF